uniref:Uncharacterized protein n=1 Tax=Araneus ventricosus TaxID=182803 RepID=A0A4Y2WTN8_ARAVE|nr:hypothetical protein AVEN_75044-1 [Araneus ventricosus]
MEINHAFDPILEVLPEVTFKDEAAIPPHTGSSLAGKSGIFLPIYRNSDHPALRRSCVACAEDHHVSRTASTNLSAYLVERFNPCHGNLCDNPLPLLTTRFPKPSRQAFFAIWDAVFSDDHHLYWTASSMCDDKINIK